MWSRTFGRLLRPAVMLACCLPTMLFAQTRQTLRLDYLHTGGKGQEIFAVDKLTLEPLPWSDAPAAMIDHSNRGTYFFELYSSDGRLLYSHGYSTIYGEWSTTAEAKILHRSFPESIRFPRFAGKQKIVISKRDADFRFAPIWSTEINPDSTYDLDTALPPKPEVIDLELHGAPQEKVDLLLLGEGYTAAERGKCLADTRRLMEGVFSYEPFHSRRNDFNVRAICSAAVESGVSRPSRGVHRRTLYGSTFDVFGEDRYALSFDDRAIREAASWAPYEAMAIVMNSADYGNGGVYALYASVSIDYPGAISTFVHEFGHHFADLGDEYYFNADVAYEPPTKRVEPWEPNVTAETDPAKIKWRALMTPGVGVPTYWPREQYENAITGTAARVAQMTAEHKPAVEIDEVKRQGRLAQAAALHGGPNADKVGLFQGAQYDSKLFRPAQSCLMIRGESFCPVCRHAIEEMIDLRVKK